jgi:hypothetical protein
MARQTSIQLTEATDLQVAKLQTAGLGTFTDIVRLAIDRMYRDEIRRNEEAWAPIATKFYVIDGDGIHVHFPDFSGETEGWDARLRHGTLDDLRPDLHLYVEVDYALEYPYASWDCEEILDDLPPAVTWNIKPRKFAEAAVVYSPKMGLISSY